MVCRSCIYGFLACSIHLIFTDANSHDSVLKNIITCHNLLLNTILSYQIVMLIILLYYTAILKETIFVNERSLR